MSKSWVIIWFSKQFKVAGVSDGVYLEEYAANQDRDKYSKKDIVRTFRVVEYGSKEHKDALRNRSEALQ